MLLETDQQLPNLNDRRLGLSCHMCGRKSGSKGQNDKPVVLKPHHVLLRKHRQDAHRMLRHQIRVYRLPNGQEIQIDELVPVCTCCHNKYHTAINEYEAGQLGGISLDEWFELYPTYAYLIYAEPPKGSRANKSRSHIEQRRTRNAVASVPPGQPRAAFLARQLQSV